MSFDGSGNYTLNFTFATEAASPPIAISKLDTEFAGIAAGLSLAILRNGNGKPTANIDWNGQKITNLGNATSDADALNRVTADGRYAQVGATVTVTGAWTFGAIPTVSGTFPALLMLDTDLTETTGKRWYIGTASDGFFVYRNTAAGGDFSTYQAVLVASNASFQWMNNVVWHAGNDGSGSGLDADSVDGQEPTSGSFTAYLRAANDGADITSGTATWKKFNGVVTLRLPLLVHSGTGTTLVVDGLPAEIRPSATYYVPAPGWNNGGETLLRVTLTNAADYLTLAVAEGGGGFNNATASKGIQPTCLTYMV